MKEYYLVKEVAVLAGVSIRTLHYYDEIDLLKPLVRSGSLYRYYGEPELLLLQQILFYRELGFALSDIANIIYKPGFDILHSLQEQKAMIQSEKKKLSGLLKTIDNTILQLTWKTMKNHKKLYDGVSSQYRDEAIHKYGKEKIEKSEKALLDMGDRKLEALKENAWDNWIALHEYKHLSPESSEVQTLISQHYDIIRQFWGTTKSDNDQKQAYAGLGQLYVDDERFTMRDGKADPEFAVFLRDAMRVFADSGL